VSDRCGVLDLRTYKLQAGCGRAVRARPRKRRAADARPVRHRGRRLRPSLDDADSYYLVRRFGSISKRNERLDTFYGSEEWRQKQRERVLALIDSFHVLLLPAASAPV
jgi:hypothetical protein